MRKFSLFVFLMLMMGSGSLMAQTASETAQEVSKIEAQLDPILGSYFNEHTLNFWEQVIDLWRFSIIGVGGDKRLVLDKWEQHGSVDRLLEIPLVSLTKNYQSKVLTPVYVKIVRWPTQFSEAGPQDNSRQLTILFGTHDGGFKWERRSLSGDLERGAHADSLQKVDFGKYSHLYDNLNRESRQFVFPRGTAPLDFINGGSGALGLIPSRCRQIFN